MFIRTTFSAIAMLVLTSQAAWSDEKKFVRKSELAVGEAVLYIYRPSAIVGMAIRPRVVVNESSARPISVGTYFPYSVKEGKVDVTALYMNSDSVTLDVKSGDSHFIKIGTKFGGRASIVIVPTDVAETEIANCSLDEVAAKPDEVEEKKPDEQK